MPGTAIILRGDARHLILPDDSVDLIVTSPPYFGQRSYTDGGEPIPNQIGAERTPAEYLDSLIECTAEMARVLKASGSIWLNLGDKYSQFEGKRKSNGRSLAGADRPMTGQPLGMPISAPTVWGIPNKSLMLLPQRYAIRCVDELGLILRAEVIWDKTNGLPESVKDRVRRSHETWFHFTKRPRYYSNIDAVRSAPRGRVGRTWSERRELGLYGDGRVRNGRDEHRPAGIAETGDGDFASNPLGPLPPSVWRYPTQPLKLPEHLGVKHYAAFPLRIVHRIVSGWCPREICTACGQARQPVVQRTRVRGEAGETAVAGAAFGAERIESADGKRHSFRTIATVVGQACGCPDLAAPTAPGVVLDPFGGVGTTALVAKALGRVGVSVDLSSDYCRAARWRCDDPRSLERAARA